MMSNWSFFSAFSLRFTTAGKLRRTRRTEPGRTELRRTEPGQTQPGRIEPGRIELHRAATDRAGADWAGSDSAGTDWAAEPGWTEPRQTEPDSGETDWAATDWAKSSSLDSTCECQLEEEESHVSSSNTHCIITTHRMPPTMFNQHGGNRTFYEARGSDQLGRTIHRCLPRLEGCLSAGFVFTADLLNLYERSQSWIVPTRQRPNEGQSFCIASQRKPARARINSSSKFRHARKSPQ